MNDLHKAAEMALEALEIWEKMQPNTSASAVRVPAIQALRQALAPKKEWVGLSVNEARKFYEKYTDREELIYAIDEFLEEKNT